MVSKQTDRNIMYLEVFYVICVDVRACKLFRKSILKSSLGIAFISFQSSTRIVNFQADSRIDYA